MIYEKKFLSFEEVKAQVKALQDEFNQRLIDKLNESEGKVGISIFPLECLDINDPYPIKLHVTNVDEPGLFAGRIHQKGAISWLHKQ